jgi:hypothetical protein
MQLGSNGRHDLLICFHTQGDRIHQNQQGDESRKIGMFNKMSHYISHIDRFSLLGSARLNHHTLVARRSDSSIQIFPACIFFKVINKQFFILF